MKKLRKKADARTVLKLAGACLASLIGSGFASGQEIIQFFAVYGGWAVAGTAVSLVIFAIFSSELFRAGAVSGGKPYFSSTFGGVSGKIMDALCILYIFGVLIVMLSGAGTALNQYMGINVRAGSVFMALLCAGSVLLGMKSLVDIIGLIGPVLILVTLGVGAYCVFNGGSPAAPALLAEAGFKKGAPNWLIAALLYPGFNLIGLAPVAPAMGALAGSRKTAQSAAVLACTLYHVALILMVFAFLSNLPLITGKQAPSIALAASIHPAVELVFTLMIILAIYSTICPMLWSIGERFFGGEGSRAFAAGTLLLTLAALALSAFFPLDVLVNKIYGGSGYVGAALIAAVFLKKLSGSRRHGGRFIAVSVPGAARRRHRRGI